MKSAISVNGKKKKMSYNIHYLQEDEIDYELSVRGFSLGGRPDEKKRTLRMCMANERRTPLNTPAHNIFNASTIDAEIVTCKNKLDDLSESLKRKGVPSKTNISGQGAVFTLLLHLAQRLNRLKPEKPEDISRVIALNKIVAELKENYFPVDSDEELAAGTSENVELNAPEQVFALSSPKTPTITTENNPITVTSPSIGGNTANLEGNQNFERFSIDQIQERYRELLKMQEDMRDLHLPNLGAIPKVPVDRRLTADARPFVPQTVHDFQPLSVPSSSISSIFSKLNYATSSVLPPISLPTVMTSRIVPPVSSISHKTNVNFANSIDRDPWKRPFVPQNRVPQTRSFDFENLHNSSFPEFWPSSQQAQMLNQPGVNKSDYRRLPTEKWGITFSGDPNDRKSLGLLDFLSRINVLAKSWKVSDDELLSSATILLTGSALQFYWAFYQSFRTWNDLVQELLSTYLSNDIDFETRQEIDNRKQRANETFMSYFSDMALKFQKLSYDVSESEMVNILLRNLNPYFAEKLFSINIETLSQLKHYSIKVDNLKRALSNFRLSNSKQINEVSVDEPENEINFVRHTNTGQRTTREISVQTEPNKNSGVKCFKCGNFGHIQADCRKKTGIVCYGCQTPGVTKPKCPKCNPGNDESGQYGTSPH